MNEYTMYFYLNSKDDAVQVLKIKTGCSMQAKAIAKKILKIKKYDSFWIS